ncbi:MAG: polysaccharide deacetylase family protein [Clostridia bacterium]|nr:polysaccharide deacetylase family protein [Clostridia bacterium]
MKKLSARAIAILTNCTLSLILIAVAAVCFLPVAGPAAGIEERVYRHGMSEDGVSLMINVYWGTNEVYGMLEVLEEYDATATFFIGGSWADDNTDCVREIAARGHEIGSHGYFHRAHEKLDYEGNVREIAASIEFLSLVIDRPVTLFAPPSGAYNDETVEAAENMGLKTILWSKDTIDWRDLNEADAYRRATSGVVGGDFILMHPMEHTLKALPRILSYYRSQGLRAISVSENLA